MTRGTTSATPNSATASQPVTRAATSPRRAIWSIKASAQRVRISGLDVSRLRAFARCVDACVDALLEQSNNTKKGVKQPKCLHVFR
jgi:hypothetical protein